MKILQQSILALAALSAASAYAIDGSQLVVASVDPEPGSIISQFTYTRISLSEPTTVASVKTTAPITYQVESFGASATVTPGYPLELSLNKSGQLLLSFSDETYNQLLEAGKWPVSDPGRYIIDIPAGTIVVTSNEGTEYTNSDLHLSYDLLANVTFTATPAEGSKVTKFDQISLLFPDYASVTVNEEFDATLTGAGGEVIPFGIPEVSGNILNIPLKNGECSTVGKYNFNLATGSVTLSGSDRNPEQVNGPLSYSFECIGTNAVSISKISPAPGYVEVLAGVSVIYSAKPRYNAECKETLKLYFEDVVVREYDNRSVRVQYAIDNDNPNLVSYTFGGSKAEFLTDPGHYRLEVPEGFMTFGEGLYSGPIDIEYTICAKPEVNIDPMPGNVESFSGLTLTFDGVTEIIDNGLKMDSNGDGGITMASSETVDTVEAEVTIEGNSVTLKFPETYTYREVYMVTIPFEAFTLKYANGEEIQSPTWNLNYVINRFPAPTADPAPGEVEELTQVTLTLEDGMTYGAWYLDPSLYTVGYAGLLESKINAWPSNLKNAASIGKTSVVLKPKSPRELAPGEYAIKVGKSCFSVTVPAELPYQSGFNNGDLLYRYTIVASDVTELTPEYENGYEFIGSISSFEVYFDKASTLELDENYDQPVVTTAEGNDVITEVSLTPLEDRAGLKVTLTPPVELNGGYVITIPAGIMHLDKSLNPEYVLNYSISGGISGVDANVAEATAVTVYGVDGTIVLRDAAPEAVKALPAGLYIVNGKKVVIR